MAQDKRVFTGGMDKDSDPRLIQGGDYRDALNVRNIASMDGTSGSVENLEGNTLVPFTFIDEVDQVIEFTSSSDGQIVIEEIPFEQVYRAQEIIFSGKEECDVTYNFGIYYQTCTVNSDGSITLNEPGSVQPNIDIDQAGGSSQGGITSPLGTVTFWEWIGGCETQDGLETTSKLISMFGPNGSYTTLNVQDYTTGEMIVIEVESLLTSSGLPLTSGMSFNSVGPITITYRSLTPNAYFHLNFRSPYSQVVGQLWSETVTSSNPIGSLWIGETAFMFIGSSLGFISIDSEVDGVNFNVDDEDVVYSNGLPIGTTGATWDLDIEGDEPTDPTITPEADDNVNIYSYNFNDVFGDFFNIDISEVFPFIDILNETGSGGGFTFDDDQEQFSNILTDIVKQPSDVGPVLVTGGGGLVSIPSGISTNFLPSTPMVGKNRSLERNTSANLKTYNQLEYYYSSDEVVELAGFSISEGTLTFSGAEVTAGELYILNAPILKQRAHKLTYDVSGLPAGNSFEFRVFDETIIGATADGTGESYFTSRVDYTYIAIVFKNDFSASDSMTITNLRLLLEKVEVSKLTVRIQTSLGIDFNLGFATSEEDLREKLREGKDVTKVPSWYPGTSLSLTKRTVGDQDNVNIIDSFEYQDLQDQLDVAYGSISYLNNEIANQENEHAIELENLNAQLATDSAAAADALDAANALNDALENEIAGVNQTLGVLEAIIIEIDDPNSEADLTTLINEYEGTKDDVNSSLTNIVTNLSHLDAELINNTALQAEIDRLNAALADSQQLVAQLQNQIFLQDNEIIELTATVDRLNKLIEDNDSEIQLLTHQVESLTNELSIAQSEIDRLTIINEQLSSLLSLGTIESGSQVETIIDLQKDLEEALELIESQQATIQSHSGEIVSLNNVIDKLNEGIDKLNDELSLQGLNSESNIESFTDQIQELTSANNTLTDKLNTANQQINELQLSAEASTEYIILQSQFVSLQDNFTKLEEDFNNLNFSYDHLLTQFNQSQENQDDGITQADVDAAYDAGVASADVSNVIFEHNQLNDHTVGIETLTNGNFREPVTKWSGENWVFENGNAVSNSKNFGQSGHLNQSVDLAIGNYLLDVDVLKIEGCNLEVIFISDRDKKVVARYTIESGKNTPILVELPRGCSSVSILVNRDKSRDYEVIIEKISLSKFVNDGSITAKLIMELLAYINQVDAGNQNLQNTILDQRRVIGKLEGELAQAREDIEEYTQALSSANNNIASLATVIIDVISDLGVSSTITADDIASYTDLFNSNQTSLSDAIIGQSNLINSLTNLLNEVDGSSSPSSPSNEKWLLTISGGLPVQSVLGSYPVLFNIGNQYLVITNSNIPDLVGFAGDSISSYNSNFLENSGFNIFQLTAGTRNARYHYYDGVNSATNSYDPEYYILQELNLLTGRANYDNNLLSWTDGGPYDGNPNTFYRTFYSQAANKSFTIKFTAHNFQPQKMVVDTNGNPYTSSSTGDMILGNRGNQRPLHTSTTYLESNGVTDGLQIEVEFLGGETGWEINHYASGGPSGNTFNQINSQSSVSLIYNDTEDWNYNVSNTSDPNYIAEGGINVSLHVEKIQQASSSSSRMASDGVESFVNALTLPYYNGQNLNSNSHMYPSSGSDIIMNKSQNIEPDLSSNLLGAKRLSKNKI